ncbi:MAG: AAA family ATPase, partial [Actinomycetota bacterium]
RVPTGWASIDRVLGGGLVPAAVALLAGDPGIGKSTLLLQLVTSLSGAGLPCLLASGEESRSQVSARARRLGIDGSAVSFTSGRELPSVLEAARAARPFLLAVDSIQALRDPAGGQMLGGPSQVRACVDALVGLAKDAGVAVVVTGHVTKDGDLAGPKTLEHAVDVILPFEGDPRSGLRQLSCGKNRFGPEGEVAWFEMTSSGLLEIDPTHLLLPGEGEPGSAISLPLAGRRGLAVEVQALVASTDGPLRRQVSGLDPRRFQVIAAVLVRARRPARTLRPVRSQRRWCPPRRPGVRSGRRGSARFGRLGRPGSGRHGLRGGDRPDVPCEARARVRIPDHGRPGGRHRGGVRGSGRAIADRGPAHPGAARAGRDLLGSFGWRQRTGPALGPAPGPCQAGVRGRTSPRRADEASDLGF